MTKVELIKRVAELNPHLKTQVISSVVNAVLDDICDKLEAGERIEIRSFGSFSIHMHKARKGRNPKTGVWVDVAEKSVPYFRPGTNLRKRIAASVEAIS
ncbi:MAG: integration host factor subunit beta [Cardiobacteriaceae bacterium]|nr:integration host factor subunit beta [Cardiobacteriaceae bacterium]